MAEFIGNYRGHTIRELGNDEGSRYYVVAEHYTGLFDRSYAPVGSMAEIDRCMSAHPVDQCSAGRKAVLEEAQRTEDMLVSLQVQILEAERSGMGRAS